MRPAALAVALLVATGIGACGSTSTDLGISGASVSSGSSGASSSATAALISDPCHLLTDVEVQTAVQKPVVVAKPDTLPNGPTCGWTVPANGTTLDLTAVNLGAEVQTVYDGSKSVPNPQFQVTPVSGVGDDAFFQVNTAATTYVRALILVKTRGAYFQLTVENKAFSVQQLEDAEKSLAAIAVGRV